MFPNFVTLPHVLLRRRHGWANARPKNSSNKVKVEEKPRATYSLIGHAEDAGGH
jgi:hypothetical protein